MRSIFVEDLVRNGGDGLPEPENVLMFSGGKDSTYLLWYCLQNNIKIDRIVFCDSTVEYPPVYDWLEYIEDRFDIEILRVVPKNTFEELVMRIRKRGKFKGKIRGFPGILCYCWVSRDLKFHKSTDLIWPNATRLIAICADEARRVKDLDSSKLKHDVRWPLIEAGITESQVIQHLKELDLYPPVYSLMEKHGAKKPRTGCWICPKMSLASMRMIFWEYPELWLKLEYWESLSPLTWKIGKTTEDYRKRFEEEACRVLPSLNSENVLEEVS